jgi:hypothetical protein
MLFAGLEDCNMKSKGTGQPILLLLTLFLSTSVHAKLDQIKPQDKATCQLLGEVTGDSGYGKNMSWQPIAKTDAERKATSLGATHVEWVSVQSIGSFNGKSTLKAYSCPP